MRVLLIESDPEIASKVYGILEQARYEVIMAADDESGLQQARSRTYDLILLARDLPQMNGWRICEELQRFRNRPPILMLMGCKPGADDYMHGPIEKKALLARIQNLFRCKWRRQGRTLRVADLVIDTAKHQVLRGEKEIDLSLREYTLLEALMSDAGRVLTRDEIQERVWMNEEASPKTVDVYIGVLRKKIDAEHHVKLIQTIYGAGYVLREP